jgi:hypothetical protein
MLWTEIRKWAKEKGYQTIKEKGDEEGAQYFWSKIDNPESSGVAKSVSKLARAIFNDITNNRWVEYQTEYSNSDV